MAGDGVTITITANNGDAVRAFRDLNGRLRDTRGRFVSEGSIMTRSMNQVAASIGNVKAYLIPLATAAVPLGAAFAPIAAKATGAGLAVAAFGAAVAGQVSSLSEATQAQDKYNDAVAKYGQGSKQAADAQRAVQAAFASMPVATARAAVSLDTLTDGFQDWSDSIADFTMAPVEKSFAVLGQLTPRLTDMAKGASTQLDRLVTVAGGAIATPGFDALSDRMSAFANEALKDGVDGIIHFARALSEGQVGGPIQAFMEYANQNGPALRETMTAVGDAVTTLVKAAADAGPGMLTLVNAAAGLVASLPPELVTVLMQTAVGLKLVTLAGAGAAAIAGGVTALGASIAGLQAASTAAGGGMAGLAAAFGTLGKAAKASVIVGGIALVAVAVNELSKIGKDAPPDIDKMTTSLGKLAQTGKLSGEAARVFGKDYDQLGESLRTLARPSNLDKFQQRLTKLIGMDSTPVKDAKEDFDALDEGLSNLVKGGNADLAKAALEQAIKGLKDQGFTADEVRGQLDGYKSALADMAFEQELTVQSMGMFGDAAQNTSATLDAQKGAADGLRASILALNEVNRSAHDAQTQFEGAIDDLTASFREHGATLDADTEAGRANRDMMSAASAAQDELIASGLAAGDSLASMTGKSEKLRGEMMRLATEAFKGNTEKAREYVNELLGVPGDIKTLVRLEREEAIAGLGEVMAAIRRTPGAKSIKVETLNGAAIKALEAVGLKTRQLPDGRTEVFTKNGQARDAIAAIRRALDALDGKTANTYTIHHYKSITEGRTGLNSGKGGRGANAAAGGLLSRLPLQQLAGGGEVQFGPDGLLSGPGSPTSDSILAMFASGAMGRVSATEFVVNAASTRKYLPLLEAINKNQLRLPGFAKGGKVSKAERDARNAARGDLTISHFGQMAGYKSSEIIGDLARPDSLNSLVGALNNWRNVIMKATHGGVEKSLLKALDSAGKKLLNWEKQLSKASDSLQKSKDRLNELKQAASQLRDSVRSGVLGSANITRGVNGDSPVTVASIMGGLTASRDKATAFAGALTELKNRGLSGALIQQIGEANIEGGGLETASALLNASSSEIASMNKLESQISSAATTAGKATADAVYASQIKTQEKLVKAWQTTTDKLTKSMESLAKSMEKLIEKGFKGKAAGGIVGAAASGGIRSNLTWVGENGPELLDLAPGSRVWSNPDSQRMQQQAWASMFNEPRRRASRGGVALAGGSGDVLVVQVRIAERDFGELWVDTGRKEVRGRGGLQATLLPPRGR